MKRILELDILRGFAIVAVVANHTIGFVPWGMPSHPLLKLNWAIENCTRFAVPAFVIFSGLVLSRIYSGTYSWAEFYKRRTIRIVPSYIIFSIVFMFFWHFEIPTSRKFISNLLTGRSSYHLWFFVLIIQLYLLYPFLNRLYESFERQNRGRTLLYAFIILQGVWICWVELMDKISGNPEIQKMFRLSLPFPAYIAYFMVGMYSGRNFEVIQTRVKLLDVRLALGLCMLIAVLMSFIPVTFAKFGLPRPTSVEGKIAWRLLEIAFSFGTFFSLFSIACKLMHAGPSILRTGFHVLGKYSYGIYLVHPIILSLLVDPAVKMGIPIIGWGWLVYYPIVFTIAIPLSLLGVFLLSHLPYSEYYIGTHVLRNITGKLRGDAPQAETDG